MPCVLTQRIVAAAQPKDSHELRDAQVRGLLLTALPSGHKAWTGSGARSGLLGI